VREAVKATGREAKKARWENPNDDFQANRVCPDQTSSKPKGYAMSTGLYDQDYAEWAEETAKLLREGRLQEVDMDHVAEEIEDMGKSQRHQLRSRVTQILEHLLKLKLTSGAVRENHERGWLGSIRRQQGEIRQLLQESPSLQSKLTADMLQQCYSDAAEIVGTEFDVEPPMSCPFGLAEVLPHER
jgi:hypothetical protein